MKAANETMPDMSLREIASTIGKSVREFKADSLRAPIYVVGEVIIECAIPFITSQLINDMQDGTEMRTIGIYGAILTGLAVLSLFCGIRAGVACSVAATGLARNLRHDMFAAIQRFS